MNITKRNRLTDIKNKVVVTREKAMAPHSSTLAWKIPWTEEPGRLHAVHGSLRVGHDWATSLSHIGEGNGNPLQCSFLENPSDRGAWWPAVYGVTQSQTRLKWLSSSSLKWYIRWDGSYWYLQNIPSKCRRICLLKPTWTILQDRPHHGSEIKPQ